MNLGEKIQFCRKKRNMTQEELAEKSGIPTSSLRKYEIGYRNPKLNQLEKIAEALSVSVYAFTDDDDADEEKDEKAVGEGASANSEHFFHSIKPLLDNGIACFDGETDEHGVFKDDSLTLRFMDSPILPMLRAYAHIQTTITRLMDEQRINKDNYTKTLIGQKIDDLVLQLKFMLLDESEGGMAGYSFMNYEDLCKIYDRHIKKSRKKKQIKMANQLFKLAWELQENEIDCYLSDNYRGRLDGDVLFGFDINQLIHLPEEKRGMFADFIVMFDELRETGFETSHLIKAYDGILCLFFLITCEPLRAMVPTLKEHQEYVNDGRPEKYMLGEDSMTARYRATNSMLDYPIEDVLR